MKEFTRLRSWFRAGLELAGIVLASLLPAFAQTAPAIDLKLPTVFVIGDSTANNDSSAPDKDRARGSLPGIGEEAKEFTMPDGRQEVVHTFGWYMRKFVAETKEKGAAPIVLSLTVRNIWTNGKVERGPGSFGKWSANVARSEHVEFADLTNAIADEYEEMGEAKVKELFPEDHAHTTAAGADLNASLVVAILKSINSPLAAWLSAKGQAVQAVPAPRPTRAAHPEPAPPR